VVGDDDNPVEPYILRDLGQVHRDVLTGTQGGLVLLVADLGADVPVEVEQAGEPAELSSGSQVRDFLDVREAARMIVDVALGSQEGPVNICSGKPVTVRELAERIADDFGRRDLLRFGARPDNPVDPACVVGVRG